MAGEQAQTDSVLVKGLGIHYRAAGEGSPVLLLHGWPTSSHMWRNILPRLAASGLRAIAPDLPGFGASDKPSEAPYTLDFHAEVIDGFLRALSVERTSLVVHDVGGPVGLLWAVRHPDRVDRLVVLDTIVYPRVALGMRALLAAMRLPGVDTLFTSPTGLSLVMRLGVVNRRMMAGDVLAGYLAPFATRQDRRTLCKALTSLRPDQFAEIARELRALRNVPTLIAWAEKDSFLPASEMRRLQRDLPHARAVTLPGCGHFLTEDKPEQIGSLLTGFLRNGA